MKTEWHRYNLKRRVAQLPSISATTFAELVLARQKQLDSEFAEEDEFGFAVNRRKASLGARQLTKKELKRLQARGRPLALDPAVRRDESVAASEASVNSEFLQFSIGDVHSIERRLTNYSDSEFTDVESGLDSDFELMAESSFEEVKEVDDDDDDEEAAPVELTPTLCFYCGLQSPEREDNIKHMFKRHGLYIPERSYLVDPDGLLLFLGAVVTEDYECLTCGFLGRNLDSIRKHLKSKGHCRVPYETKEEKEMVSEFYDFEVAEPSIEAANDAKLVAFAEDADNYTVVQVDPTGVELTLPTGLRIGHRSMTRYYRQNLALPREAADLEKTVAVADRRFAPGLTSKEVTRQEKLTRRIEQRVRNQYFRKDKGSKINFQPHFRDELLGPM